MKTYSEVKNNKPINWFEVLDNWSNLSQNRKTTYINKAGSWVTCACGNQCAILERDENGEPKNSELERLGINFYYNLKDERIKDAKASLKKIERLSTKLIRETIKEDLDKYKNAGFSITIK